MYCCKKQGSGGIDYAIKCGIMNSRPIAAYRQTFSRIGKEKAA